MSNPRYVVWNGRKQKDYHWNGSHDCAVTYDNHLISVQKVRQYFLRNGIEPVIEFTCQVGQSSVEVNIADQGWRGIGSYCFSKVVAENPAITFRNLIRRMNDLIVEMGFDQVSEVICKYDLLDHTLRNEPPYPKPLATMFFDICRTPSEPGRYILDHDEFSP
jgi:hypothetical protein